jgi:hypothetical protein
MNAYIHIMLDTFLTNVADHFHLAKTEIEREWEKACASNISHVPVIRLIDHTAHTDHIQKAAVIKNNVDEKRCSYVYQKSGRFFKKGEQCKKECKDGFFTCEKHLEKHLSSYSSSSLIEKNGKNDDKKIIQENKQHNQNDLKNVKNDDKNEKRKSIMLKLNANINRFVHSLTQLVFYSKDDRFVFAKLDDDECTLLPLTSHDIDVCKYYGFRVNTSINLE